MENFFLNCFFIWPTEMEDQKKSFRQKGHLDFCYNHGVLFCAQSEKESYLLDIKAIVILHSMRPHKSYTTR